MNSLKNIIDSRLDLVSHFTDKSYCVCKSCGKEWRTKLVNGEREYDLKSKCDCGCIEYETTYLLDNNSFVIQVLEDLVRAYKTEIHEYLVPSNLPDKETQIRNHIKDIMTKISPIVDGRINAIKKSLDSIIYTKNWDKLPQQEQIIICEYLKIIDEIEKENKRGNLDKEYPRLKDTNQKCYSAYKNSYNKNNICDRLCDLTNNYITFLLFKDDLTALVAFRHFETYCLYIDQLFDNNIFTPALHLFRGFYFYANSMVLNEDVKFIEKQCFAGAGKSATDCALISFLFGYNIDNDVLKIFGNKDNVTQTMDMILTIMCSKQYAKVFPYYAKFKGEKEAIFTTCKPANGEFKISGSIKSVNLRVRAKGEKTDGVRAKYLFLDDITASDDAEKIEQHQKDIFLYTARWFKRKYDNNNFYIIASGTTYHQEDFLSYLKHIFGAERAKESKFKFTSISKSNEIVPNGLSVFCVIYGLDENEKSTFEAKFPTQSFLLEREKNLRNFMAMVQQQPQPPLGAPFDYENLPNLYGGEGIPHLQDRSQEVCRASLDPARKGKDFHSMPIINTINGRMFLQDCIFEQCPPEKLPLKVIDMIEKHHIVHLDIENNTSTDLKTLLNKLLKERGINFCKITDFYSYKKKDEKISECETAIKSICFPNRDVYSPNSPMGKFMYWLTAYNYETPPKHDDSVDSLANFSLNFILNKNLGVKVRSLKKR